MTRNPDIMFITEYLKNVIYFATVRQGKTLKSTVDTHYFCIDNDLVYENYYSDFGPLNLGCVYKYCMILNDKVKVYFNKQIIVHYTSIDPKKKANAAFLLGCYGVLYLDLSPKDALKPLIVSGQTYKPFQDATQGESMYTISLIDCLQAIKKARQLGLFNFQDFNFDEYDRLDKIHGGDLNWIVPGKFLAFIGPEDYSVSLYHPPEMYIDYFLENNVKIVIRLNQRLYDGNTFSNVGIVHYDLFFLDGTCPPRHIMLKFLQISEESDGAIAVHCKAGLGRTGSLIGCYLMKHYRMTSHEAIGWMRICRPGSVIGHQQSWLEQIEPWLIKQGNLYRKRNFNDSEKMPIHKYGVYSMAEKRVTMRSPMRSTISSSQRVIRKEQSPIKIQSLPAKEPTSMSNNDKSVEDEEVYLTHCDLTEQPTKPMTSHKGCLLRTNVVEEEPREGNSHERRFYRKIFCYKYIIRNVKDFTWATAVRLARIAPNNCYYNKFCIFFDAVVVFKTEKPQWRLKSPKATEKSNATIGGLHLTNTLQCSGAGEPRSSRTNSRNSSIASAPVWNQHVTTTRLKAQRQNSYEPAITTFRSTNGPTIKNVHEAKDYLLKSSFRSEERSRQLNKSLIITSPNTPNKQYSASKDRQRETTKGNTDVLKQAPTQRRRLGRSPSPPPLQRVPKGHTRATNTDVPKEFPSKESSSILDALSRLKRVQCAVIANREGSVGAGSLGSRRDAPAPRRLAPSVRSDERPLATQGDMLNSIKFQRRLRDSLHCGVYSDKTCLNPQLPRQLTTKKCNTASQNIKQEFVPRLPEPRCPMSSMQVTRPNQERRPTSPKGKRSPHLPSFY